jgi:hypothetical protein
MGGTPDANAGSKLPDPIKAGVAEKLFRLDCGRSLANDESVWTPGENVGRSIEFSSTCWLIKHGKRMAALGCRMSEKATRTNDTATFASLSMTSASRVVERVEATWLSSVQKA